MLYLEALSLQRCAQRARRACRTGRSHASRSCSRCPEAPAGSSARTCSRPRLDLEVASGNDAHRVALGDPQDREADGAVPSRNGLVTSGTRSMPRRDNTFGGGNFDADDLDEWLTVQRDWQVDTGIEPVSEERFYGCAEQTAHAVQAVFEELGLPAVSNEEVAAATTGYDSSEMPERNRAADVEAADELLARRVSGLDVALALEQHGFGEIAEAVVSMQRQRVSADYLQTSAVIDAEGLVHSAVNDPTCTRARHGLPARGRALGAPAVAPERASIRPSSSEAARRESRS